MNEMRAVVNQIVFLCNFYLQFFFLFKLIVYFMICFVAIFAHAHKFPIVHYTFSSILVTLSVQKQSHLQF